MLGRVYDIIKDTRFLSWFQPNVHQSAYRAKQGSLLPLFSLFLMIDVAKKKGISLFIFLLDYEKAFDYTNRVEIAKKLQADNIGDRALKDFINMYSNTSYVAKISMNEVGPDIRTEHGLTQGKNSSASLFTYYISDMHDSIANIQPMDYFDPLNLLQVADDTTALADGKESLTRKAIRIFEYSDEKYLVINVPKTKYMEFSDQPDLSPMQITEDTFVEAVSPKELYCWLGFWLSYADNVPDLIQMNLNKKAFNICKFYGWLHANQETPIIIKLKVLYSCMFAAILYSCETWGDIEKVAEQLLLMERKALRSCLGVKDNVPNDIIYQELNIPDIIAKIVRQQQKFFTKLMTLEPHEAIVRQLIDMISTDETYMNDEQSYLAYYCRLLTNTTDSNNSDSIIDNNRQERRTRLENGGTTKIAQYREISGLEYNKVLYNSFVNDELRTKITRWRLSCHKLRIETGRYTHPITPRDLRLCKVCNVIEDESHALFHCSAHMFIRIKYSSLLNSYTTVNQILNPQNSGDIVRIGVYIGEVEKNMKKLKMCS